MVPMACVSCQSTLTSPDVSSSQKAANSACSWELLSQPQLLLLCLPAYPLRRTGEARHLLKVTEEAQPEGTKPPLPQCL